MLQTTKLNFEKLLGCQVFKKHNYNPFQSSSISCPSVPPFVLATHVIYTFFECFLQLFLYFIQFGGRSYCLNFS